MRYQNYKAKMQKIRKVIDVFYHLRFVFIGVAVVAAASITTLDLTKGNITEVSEFEISYTYGEDIKYSGSAFMGNVTFEFRRKGEEDWTENKPRLVGQYEARAKSVGNHGYKYSSVSNFEIKPYPVDITLSSSTVTFGNDHPSLDYKLLAGDTLSDEYVINYEDLTVKETKASIDKSSLKVTDKDGADVTSCYTFNCIDKEITFTPAPITITFDQNINVTYSGEEYTNDGFKCDIEPFYGAKVVVTPGHKVSGIGKYVNEHEIKIIDGEIDYTDNYSITRKVNGATGTDNYIQINKLPALHIASGNLNKVYDGKPFSEEEFEKSITVTGSLFPGHKLEYNFARTEVKDYTQTALSNEFEYTIYDSDNNPIDLTSDDCIYETPTTSFGTVRINKRPVRFTFNSIEEIFRNIEYKDAGFTVIPETDPNRGLLTELGHQIVIDETDPQYNPAFIEPTDEARVENLWGFAIKQGDIDVTENYDVTAIPGTVSIKKIPLKFEFTANTGVLYDGLEHPYYIGSRGDNAAVLADGYSLPDGWEYEVTIDKMMKDYSENGYTATEEDISFSIIDKSDPLNPIDISHCYKLEDFEIEFPTSSIIKRPVQIAYRNYTPVKEYNGIALSNDIIIDPNAPGSCVECENGTLEGTSGLVSGDYLDVNFVTTGSTYDNPNNAKYANKDGEKYKFGLSYSIRNGDKVVTNNYAPSFTTDLENNEQAITASIAKKTIVVSTADTSKIYDATTSFSPILSSIHSGELGEKVDFDTTVKNGATVSDSIAGTYYNYLSDYENLANHVIIRDATSNADITSNYNIVVECNGKLTIDQRPLTIFSLYDYNNGDRIAYDEKPHGVFTNEDGTTHSAEFSYDYTASASGYGLISGQRLVMTSGQSIVNEGDLNIYGASNATFGTKIYDGDREVTDSYSVGYTDFRLRIVKGSIMINPYYQSKAFDGLPFEVSTLENVPFGEFRSYNSAEMKKLYNVSFGGVSLQSNHELQLTKYSKETSEAYTSVGSDNHYYEYEYRVVDISDPNNPTDVTSLYNIDAPQDLYRFTVTSSRIDIGCSGGGNAYTGNNCQPPASSDWFALDFSTSKPAFMISETSSVKDMNNPFFSKYSVQAKFDDAGYEPTNMWRVGTYYFPVQIRIEDLETHEYKTTGEIDGMDFAITSYNYGYTISKRKITVTSVYYPSKDQEKRSIGGSLLANGDVLYFGDYFGNDYEELKSGRSKYYKPLRSVVIVRNGLYDVTDCYDITYID